MEIYAVGGAVRDQLLGRCSEDIDYVVVGSTPEELIGKGFIQIGKNFPVFLHPKTKAEYALARTEKKIGSGYHGFSFDFSEGVTLEEDLRRRDLTINAMARRVDFYGKMIGNIIDPYNGVRDLQNRVLRHICDSFQEDPVRILRVARFSSRFTDFRIDLRTDKLMKNMISMGEVNYLDPDRIWKEMSRALLEKEPSRFFRVLHKIGALRVIFPELDRLWSIKKDSIETWGTHAMMMLNRAVVLGGDLSVRWSALVHALGSIGYCFLHPDNNVGTLLVEKVCRRFRVPSACRDLALLAMLEHKNVRCAEKSTSVELIALLERCDAFRRPERFFKMLLVCEAEDENEKKNSIYLKKVLSVLKDVDFGAIFGDKIPDPIKIRERILIARTKALDLATKSF